MNRWREILVVVVVLAGPIAQASAGWQNNAANYYRTNSTIPSAGITEQKAITIAQQRFKGRVLAINHSDDVYRIKILSSQGTIHIILINALDGAIISTH
ncbi:peptidase YpeB-like protein [Nitrosomonas sp. Nm84]|uniref:PepSY domain-containing protein n=1 Tax=Nitrosomonas sp. Nm84 TaxID=200124 RepID=UPI000D76A81B|nr:PepSY domain-containing protein [Nitrosomonas sp. Nm84]PXW89631.1 peptidase YpeB-like protein [Nitrosomonas sp. Nm84]